jgi:phage terminase large subunit-like protein
MPGQEPPAGDWDIWLIEGDRRTGKTFAGARWLLTQALAGPEGSLWAICGPAYLQARFSLEALIAQAAPGDVESYARARLDVTLRNKARIKGFSSESPYSMRGYNLAGAWFDDAGHMRHYSFYSDGLLPSLRTGKKPRLVITAEENRFGLIRELEEKAEAGDEGVVVTRLTEPVP